MSISIIWTLAQKELREALRNRWFVLYTLAFIGLALALSYMSLAGAGISGFAGFGRTAASLINLVLLIIPLMALTVGAQSLAHEAEHGTLAYLLAQPVTRAEVFAGKYLGLALALTLSTLAGFTTVGSGLSVSARSAAVFALLWAVHFAYKKVIKKAPSPIGMIVLAAGLGILFWGV